LLPRYANLLQIRSFFTQIVHACGVFSQPEDELVSLLQNLEDMDVTYKAPQVKFFFHSISLLRLYGLHKNLVI
jgi:hypothetical protein